jgi:hypothetical protein
VGWQLFTHRTLMGQAKRRKKQLGSLYGTPEGSNRPNVVDLIKVRRSHLTDKWAVDVDMPSGRRRLTVYYQHTDALADADIAKEVFGAKTVEQLEDEGVWLSTLLAYGEATKAGGLEDDDEILAVWKPLGNGWVIEDTRPNTLDQQNAQLRELDLLSDRVWYRDP